MDTGTTRFYLHGGCSLSPGSDMLISAVPVYFMQSLWKLDVPQKSQCEFVLTDYFFLYSGLFVINLNKGQRAFGDSEAL